MPAPDGYALCGRIKKGEFGKKPRSSCSPIRSSLEDDSARVRGI
jgi:hypothetical protein